MNEKKSPAPPEKTPRWAEGAYEKAGTGEGLSTTPHVTPLFSFSRIGIPAVFHDIQKPFLVKSIRHRVDHQWFCCNQLYFQT